ncbi:MULTISPECIES: hypothetical protein [Fictibacillus]|jgi:heme exporter protein D|uniref:hypothetical protein n=1 Tax=Fictibacillus TaxID=1329200 RepID=UPI0010E7FCEF|nr:MULTISPECIES: hypothetical protein [Fictibacillus]RZT23455.1 hypothetical protein EV282_2545 [Fictibacillus sp. BK138]
MAYKILALLISFAMLIVKIYEEMRRRAKMLAKQEELEKKKKRKRKRNAKKKEKESA